MPSYDLRCDACGLNFEVFHPRFLREGDRTCPGCGSRSVAQRLTGFITSRPARDNPNPTVTGFAQHTCHAGCAHAHRAPNGEIVPP
ncbi:MAG TPA: zinc ribbon domain-containing protein [Miltoncostaeaceae bacterium]|nr:zinc ribbon domain-containing protein [Miltoncostaeaceae bacterium]